MLKRASRGSATAIAIALISVCVAAPVAAQTVPTGYKLVWSDEFDTPGLPDPAKWSYDTVANKTGWYNHELEYYAADRPRNARVENGQLVITARHEALSGEADYGGQQYSSARLVTRGEARWTYGFFEIRAKLPCGRGTWPAIWTLGSTGDWPRGGEIDIMEHVGDKPDTIFGTIHDQATAGTSGDGGSIDLPDACTAFHRYQLTWTPDRLDIGVDDHVFHSYRKIGNGADGWPFDAPQYLLLNLAIGGDMAGAVDDAALPAEFDVDYVRVYQRTPTAPAAR